MLLDQLPQVFDGAGRLRTAHEKEVLAVPGNPVQAGSEPLVCSQAGATLRLGHARGHDLLADVLDRDCARLLGQTRQGRLHSDESVEEVLLLNRLVAMESA